MDNHIAGYLRNICGILEKNSVEYLVVGGTAVALHGYLRVSLTSSGMAAEKPDFDFWYNPAYKNYFNLLNSMGELGQDVSEFIKEKTPDPQSSFFKLETDLLTIDFLPSLPGLKKFKDSFREKEVAIIDGVQIAFLNLNDLLINKHTMARDKDLNDIEHLK